ncbi:MAG: hypothetical protein KCHDKBKB_00810 [Elusimicrobia bacterium]|nr:hypothetical protein [Elusimicrobiota bacterium]
MLVAAAGMMTLVPSLFATGTSASQFLKLGAGARSSAMGNAYSAVSNDVTATYWNPAGLAQLETPEIGVMQNTHLVDTQYQYLAGVMPTPHGVMGLSLSRLDYGTLDRYSNADVKEGSFDANSMAANISLGRQLNDSWMLGATVKYISETLESEKASGFAFDLGALYKFNDMNLSAVIQHIGPKMKMVQESAPLPMTIRFGASRKVLQDKLLLALDFSKPNDANISIHGGVEYQVVGLLALRGGYVLTPGQSTDLGGLTNLNAGLGISFNRFNLDYSVSPFGDLGISHRVSIGYKFNSIQQ